MTPKQISVGGGAAYPFTFKPQIQKKSQNLKRDKSIDAHLYEDYLERRKKQELVVQGMEAHYQQRVAHQGTKVLSEKSEQYLIQRFTKEIVSVWQQSLEVDEESQSNETMDM